MPDLSAVTGALSSAGGKVKENLAHNLGGIEKAVIEIYDLRTDLGNNGGAITLEPVDTGGSKNKVKMGAGGEGGMPTMTYLDQRSAQDALMLAQPKYEGASQTLSDAANKIDSLSSSLTGDKDGISMTNVTRKLYTVQFNPSSVQLSAHGGGLVRKLNYEFQKKDGQEKKDEGNNITYGKEETTIILTIPLFFDRCDIQDAFGADKLNTSFTEMGKGLVKAAMTLAGKKEVSVQKEVEGFVGMIRNRYTRFISFHWGDVTYSGMVNDLDVRYTMFNITGQPVRAVVNMSVMCLNTLMYKSNFVWRDIYKRAYEEKKGKLNSALEFGNSAKKWTGSFLNL